MRSRIAIAGLALLAGAALGAGAVGAVGTFQDGWAGPGQDPGRAVLDRYLGRWSVTASLSLAGDSVESRGYEEIRLGPGGRWLVRELSYDVLGTTFESHGMIGYSPATNTYLLSSVDSADDLVKGGTATWDPDQQALTIERSWVDAAGQPAVERIVDRFDSPTSRVRTIRAVAADGTEFEVLELRFTRASTR